MSKDSPARIKRRALARAEMFREYAEGMAAAEMDYVQTFPHDHVERRRIWTTVPDRRSLTGRLLGDPIPERSALRFMEAAE